VRSAADRVIGALTRLITRAWFRRVETVGMERLLDDRPLVVVANHSNGFVDPVLLLALSPRPLRLLAKATLWKVPGVKWLMAFAGVLPVHRSQDASGTKGNVGMFATVERELADDAAIALFPEGTVNDQLRLMPLKTGAARIALGARTAGAQSLRIVPVGLVYADKTRPRTDVLVRAGEPIDLDEAARRYFAPGESEGPDNHAAVDRLTSLIAARLAAAATDYDRGYELGVLAFASNVYHRSPDADPSRQLPLSEIEPTMRRLNLTSAEHRAAVVAAAERYRASLSLAELRDGDVVPGNTSTRVMNRVRLSAGKATLFAPFGAIGAVVNGVPFLVVKAATLTKAKAPVDVANFRLLASLVAFPITWTGWGFAVRRAGVRHPWLAAFLGGPLTGHAAVVTWEKLQNVRTARVQWRHTRREAAVLDELRAERADVVAAVAAALT
jgi:1-acyl-sn-glycerol-3-phosphate acyltransferase